MGMILCQGCDELKENSEIKPFYLKHCKETEDLCKTCRRVETINEMYYELEDKEIKYTDEWCELHSLYDRAMERAEKIKSQMDDVRSKIRKNQSALYNFDWSQEVLLNG